MEDRQIESNSGKQQHTINVKSKKTEKLSTKLQNSGNPYGYRAGMVLSQIFRKRQNAKNDTINRLGFVVYHLTIGIVYDHQCI